MSSQCRACPQLRRIAELFGLAARQMYDPGFGVIGNDRFPGLMRSVLHARLSANLERLVNPLENAFASHLLGARDLANSLTAGIPPQDLGPLNLAERSGLGLT